MNYEQIYETCCKFVADLFNRRDPSNPVNWKDFNVDWRGILNDVKKIRIENLLKKFNVRQTLDEEFEDL